MLWPDMVLPTLTTDQRYAILEHGAPLPLADDVAGQTYMLLPVEFLPDPLGGVTARIPGINAFGGGDSKEEAALALAEALRGYLKAFGGP